MKLSVNNADWLPSPPDHRDTFSGFGPDGEGGGDGGDNCKPAQETPEERREAENEQKKEQIHDMTNAALVCQYGIKAVSLTGYECQPPPSENQSGG